MTDRPRTNTDAKPLTLMPDARAERRGRLLWLRAENRRLRRVVARLRLDCELLVRALLRDADRW